jgi:3-dehydro-L-gulonate 2-dehydrogenase
MSQFSYGALANYRKQERQLPVDGGFDLEGNLTRDPGAIESSQRPLPIGYWKGAGLALVLDLIAAMSSLGKATHQIPADPLLETEISQVFLAIHPAALGDEEQLETMAEEIIANFHQCVPANPQHPVRYPGEQVLRIREENTRLGVPVEEDVWQEITAML